MIATIRHLNKDRVLLRPGEGYEIVMFDCREDGMEAVVSSLDGEEATRLKVAPPRAGQEIEVIRNPDGSFEVYYHDI